MRNNTNAAYDLSLFEPKTDKVPLRGGEENAGSKSKAARPRSTIRPLQAMRWTAGAIVLVAALGSIMVCNVQNTKLNDQVASMKTKLAAAQADEVRLNMQLQSRASLGNVQNYAVSRLGMQKTSTYQIQYIHLTDKDKVVVQKSQQGILSRLYNWILEYL